jgi:hypothetical protein
LICFLFSFDQLAGATALDKSAVPIYLPKGTYTIIAKSGGFDAGDGKMYFKAELRFVGKAHLMCVCSNTMELHQQDIHVFYFFLLLVFQLSINQYWTKLILKTLVLNYSM